MLTAVTEWEAQNARSQRERAAQARQEHEQEQLLTYTREDAYSAVWPCRGPVCTPQKPVWDLCATRAL